MRKINMDKNLKKQNDKKSRILDVVKGVFVFVYVGIFYTVIMTALDYTFENNMLIAFSSAKFDKFFGGVQIFLPKSGGQMMLADLLSFDFSKSQYDNLAWIVLFPFIFVLTVKYLARYVKTGSLLFKRYEKISCVVIGILFIAFAIFRTVCSFLGISTNRGLF